MMAPRQGISAVSLFDELEGKDDKDYYSFAAEILSQSIQVQVGIS